MLPDRFLEPDVDRLAALGWDRWFAERFEPLLGEGLVPARVVADYGAARFANTGGAELAIQLAARLADPPPGAEPVIPTVGDWVAVRSAAHHVLVEELLERRTAISRKVAGQESRPQVLAANVDVVFVVTAADRDFNLRRIERYLAVVWSSGAEPAVLLSKADLAARKVERLSAEVARVAPGVPVLAVSGVTGQGLDGMAGQVGEGRTAVLVGSSGVGKSTLVNRLLGHDALRTQELRSDGRGRHTTTHRQLVRLPWGGLVIDTPGLREIQLWVAEEGLDRLFADVEELAARCRFSNCSHGREPGCAVRAAIEGGELAEARLRSYRKLVQETELVGELAARRRERAASRAHRRAIAALRERDR